MSRKLFTLLIVLLCSYAFGNAQRPVEAAKLAKTSHKRQATKVPRKGFKKHQQPMRPSVHVTSERPEIKQLIQSIPVTTAYPPSGDVITGQPNTSVVSDASGGEVYQTTSTHSLTENLEELVTFSPNADTLFPGELSNHAKES